jgi:agmatinase
MVVCIGGEHTVAIGAAQAYTQQYADLSILHFDAHSDLRQEYEGNRYSHGCSMARIYDFNRNIVQVGIRSQGVEEAAFIKEHAIDTFYAIDIKQGRYGHEQALWHKAVIDKLHESVYITFDCDFFDPSLVPALGTPEPGGFGWDETISFLRELSKRRRIVGFDVNELSPAPPFIHSQFTVAKLIYKLLGYIFIDKRA